MASADGYFYMFDVNTQEGGICKLLTQSSIYVPSSSLFNNSVGKDLVNNSNFNSNPVNVIDNSNKPANTSCNNHFYQNQLSDNSNEFNRNSDSN